MKTVEIGQRVLVKTYHKVGTVVSIAQGPEAVPIWGLDFGPVVRVEADDGDEYVVTLDDIDEIAVE